MENENKAFASGKHLALYFALTLPIAWVFWIPMILINKGIWSLPVNVPTFVWSTLGSISPLVAIGILQRVSHKKVSLKRIFKNIRLREWRSSRVLASPFIIVGIYLVMILIYFGVETLRGGDPGPVHLFKPEVFETLHWWILLVIPLHFTVALITSPLFEEPGWRGFAFENLRFYVQRDIASLIVGSYWWLWHQGMNIAFNLEPTLYGYFSMVLDSFAIDALYTLSKRNILAAMMAHQAMGTLFMFFLPLPTLWYLIIVKLALVMTLRLQIRHV